jgi:hypothetical protein
MRLFTYLNSGVCAVSAFDRIYHPVKTNHAFLNDDTPSTIAANVGDKGTSFAGASSGR